jgi:hypothetical protein
MKKITLLSLITLVFISNLISQAPNLMSYQAVIWDASGNLVAEKMVSIKISILQGSVSGSSVYSENHRVQTNINGLVSLMIGGGTNATGKISDINWGGGTFFLKTETDPTGGNSYSIIGTTQLVSVPYSLFSGLSKNIQTPKKKIGHNMGARSGWHIPPGNKALVGLNFLCKQRVKSSAGVHVLRGQCSSQHWPIVLPPGYPKQRELRRTRRTDWKLRA